MYVVIELQKLSDTQLANIVTTHETKQEADSKFHTILAAAAISTVPVHSAAMLTDEGRQLRFERYIHDAESTEETEE